MTTVSIIQVVIAGIQTGSIYALIALGYYVILTATGILNFAQGEWMMLAAVFGVLLLEMGFPYWAAVLISIGAATCVALLVERILIRPLHNRHASAGMMLLVLFAVLIVARHTTAHLFGPLDHPLPGPFPERALILGRGLFILPQTFVVVATVIAVFAAMWLFTRWTWTGRSLRVAAIDPIGAQMIGIDLGRIRLVAFGLGGLIAALTGWLYGPLFAVSYSMGAAPGIKGFIALIIGGMGSPLGALAGGLTLGLLELAAARYASSLWSEAVSFVVLIIVLLIRPSGLIAPQADRPR
jgi:branched-chain amino acid transport system permease protein